MKTYVAIFVSVLLAELGDKTQLATLFFATDSTINRGGVLLAAATALVVSTAVAVVVGAQLSAWVPTGTLRVAAALGFVAVGLWMLVRP
jgi:putative Ca2+/H+ antiporter (TMEM165/GDT1 family)